MPVEQIIIGIAAFLGFIGLALAACFATIYELSGDCYKHFVVSFVASLIGILLFILSPLIATIFT